MTNKGQSAERTRGRNASPSPKDDDDLIAVVIPAYNEAPTIREVVERALASAGEVIVIDDGSSDGTVGALAGLSATVIDNPANRGKGASLRQGMALALARDAAVIVTLDGDGQHRPEDVLRLAAAWRAAPDRIVIGSRRGQRRAMPRARSIANRIADFWISWAAGYPIDDTQSGFRLYPAAILRRLLARCSRHDGFVFESEMLIEAGRLGVQTTSIEIDALYDGVLRRPSYFRPVVDIARIVIMVAGKLLTSGMNPAGLRRYLAASSR